MIRMFVLLGIVLSIIVVGVRLWIHTRINRKSLNDDFKEYIRNPGLKRKQIKAYVKHKLTAAKLTQESPEKLVRMLLDEDTAHDAKPAIREVGPEIIPYLIAALNDPEYRKPANENAEDSSDCHVQCSVPIMGVLQCLEHYAPPAAVNSLNPLVTDENKEIREHAALVLGMIATDDTMEPLRKALADEDEYVRGYAMMGILRALEAGRGSKTFCMGMFEAILPLIRCESKMATAEAPKCLLRLDRERALSILTAADTLSPDGKGLLNILRALREAEVVMDPQKLIHLIELHEEKTIAYPNYYIIGEALQLLARVGRNLSEVQSAIRHRFDSPSKEVRQNAYQAFAYIKGITAPLKVAFDRFQQQGWESLSTAQRHVLAVRILIDEVNNGGFEQYFVNSSGDHWSDALAGFKAIQATKDFELVRRTFGFFGPDGPSTNGEKRHKQLARIVRKDAEIFSAIDSTFFENEEDREVLLLRYIIEHESDFRGNKGNGEE